MRKKSHISLARYIVDSLEDKNLEKHKLSFYLGSILPDIKPSFIYKRHEMNGTYPALKKLIKRLSESEKQVSKKKTGRKYYMDLGQISHYLADYFTFPHNVIYPGTLKEHCSYEEKLKRDLRTYLKSGEVEHQNIDEPKFSNAEKLCDFIQQAHDDYIVKKHNVENDIQHIIEVNQMAMGGIINLLEVRKQEYFLKHS